MKAIKAFFVKVGDMFLDQAGGLDEKRVIGVGLVVAAVVYVFTRPAGADVWVTAAGLLGFALTFLGVSVAGDQGKLGGPQ
jgi:hypothetical protein